MNFHGIEGLDTISEDNNTSQETYRILKYNCARIGNIIDANKYHALELQKRKEEIDKYIKKRFNQIVLCITDVKEYNGSISEWIVFQINWYSSKFGTSWILSLYWIFFVGFITALCMHCETAHYVVEHPSVFLLEEQHYGQRAIKAIAKYMSIVHYETLKDYPIIFLLNKVTLGYLYYQFLTAIRKDTRK